ncbi:MAG: hypothetical protein EHM21_04155 [Chloroflexi bacterium]|nr:MAG: hypothetical protein EHM21_04155 [Chloroflexota bacterium]
MSEQENIKIARQYTENLSKHTNDANRTLLADDVRTDASGERQAMNKDQTLMYNERFLSAFPDLHFDVKDIIAQGDHVVTTWVASGTHTKPLSLPGGGSLPATNRKASVPGVTVATIRNNKITHQMITWDQVSFLMQLGLMTEQDLMAMARR